MAGRFPPCRGIIRVSAGGSATAAEPACRARCCGLRRLRLSRRAATGARRASVAANAGFPKTRALFGDHSPGQDAATQAGPGSRRDWPSRESEGPRRPDRRTSVVRSPRFAPEGPGAAWRRGRPLSTMRANSFASRAPRRASIAFRPVLRRAIVNLLEVATSATLKGYSPAQTSPWREDGIRRPTGRDLIDDARLFISAHLRIELGARGQVLSALGLLPACVSEGRM